METTTQSMNDLKLERAQLFKDSITGNKKKDRIFNFANVWSWKTYDAGYKFSEALYSYEIYENVMRHFYDTYKVDCCYETGWRNPNQVTDALGRGNAYVINDKDYSISVHDQTFMDPEDYDALIANPKKFLWETFLPRKFEGLKNTPNSDTFRNFLMKYGEFGGFMGKICQMEYDEYGLPDLADPQAAIDYWGNGYELLFCVFRGIKGTAYDIRRQPEKVLDAIQALEETFTIPKLERGKAQPKGTNPNYCVDTNPVLLGHIILSTKQFEKFYWPHLKRTIDLTENYDKYAFMFCEGESARFFDFFREFPKDRYAVLCEMDDIFEMKKVLPNVAVTGGMPTEILGRGTPDECVDYTKKLIDELNYDNRYIFSENKMISFPHDCKRENLIAVCDYLYELAQ